MANLARRISSTVSGLHRLISSHPLTHDARLSAWKRFVVWQVASRFRQEIVVPWVDGRCLALRRGMSGATGNHYVGLHEFMGMMLTMHFLREGDLFIDAGANVGTYTVLAAGVGGATVWAFEPATEVLGHLRRNIEVNALDSVVTVYPVALGASDGEIAFTEGLDAINRVATAADRKSRIVPQRSLDSLLGDRAPIMIKMDLEGHEEQAFRGAQRVIADQRLMIVSVEETTPWMEGLFARSGFERAFYDPFTRVLQRTPNSLAFSNGQWTPSNQFYVRTWDFVQDRLTAAASVRVLAKRI